MRREIEKKLSSIFVAVAVGMSLFFILASSYPLTIRALGGLAGVGLALLQFALRRKLEKRLVIVDQVALVIDAQASRDVFLAPIDAIINPRIVIAVMGGRALVEDAWHNGVSVVPKPLPASHWQKGVTYPGVLDYQKPFKLLIRNESDRPSTVCVRVLDKRRRT